MQLEYSLVQRSIEREHLPLAASHDIAVTAWSPLAGGILSGKYNSGMPHGGPVRMDSMQLQPLDERNSKIAEAVSRVSRRLGVSAAQLSLAWVLSRGVIPIAGATTAEQMNDNMKCVEVHLDGATLAELDAASAFDAGHPYNMLSWDMSMTLGYGGMFDKLDIPRFPRPIR